MLWAERFNFAMLVVRLYPLKLGDREAGQFGTDNNIVIQHLIEQRKCWRESNPYTRFASWQHIVNVATN